MHVSHLQISQQAILHNLAQIKQSVPGNPKIAAVLKANAYGHGLKELAQVLENQVDYIQLDDLEELERFRNFSAMPVLLLGYLHPDQYSAALRLRAELALWDPAQLQSLQKAAAAANQIIRLHLGLDTGFGREGLLPEQITGLVQSMHRFPNLTLVGAYSHLANVDDPTFQAHTDTQLQAFQAALQTLGQLGHPNLLTHISATAGSLMLPSQSANPLVRIGIGLYGYFPSEAVAANHPTLTLTPALTWISQVAMIKTVPQGQSIGYGSTFTTAKATQLALIPQGYSDGLDRRLSNQGTVLIAGTHCLILGRVSMNMLVVDSTHLPDLKPGAEVVLLGRQGESEITANTMANLAQTIHYQILSSISPLIARSLV